MWIFQNLDSLVGHIISKEGVVVDSEKIKAIMEWPTRQNATKVRSFMGLARNYRRFIWDFSNIRHPTTTLQRKWVKLQWKPKCTTSFEQLKKLLTRAPILGIIDPKKDFVFYIDACKEGLGGVLMQEGYVVCYELRKLNEHEKNYVTHDLELAVNSAQFKNVEALSVGKKFYTDGRPQGIEIYVWSALVEC